MCKATIEENKLLRNSIPPRSHGKETAAIYGYFSLWLRSGCEMGTSADFASVSFDFSGLPGRPLCNF
jgi:hypothetical protein